MEISAGAINLAFWKVTEQPGRVGQDGDGESFITVTGAVCFSAWWGVHFTLKGPSHSEE